MKTTFTLGALLLYSVAVHAQDGKVPAVKPASPALVENVGPKAGQVNIPYKRYTLSNGLNILIHEDHSDPIAYVDVTYHVGSSREQQGRSGFAHFFEHMMFQGSKNVADEQHFKIITEAGGTLNGTTNTDRTNYFETVPSNQLEKMLWLEADRMGFLLDSVTQKKFEVQRATVKNERGQRYDNAPYGLVGEKIGEALYPKGHPYSWTTIGYIADLDRVDVNDLKRFYMRWYGPNNAVLTVAGDVKTEEVLKLAEKYFGAISKGPSVNEQKVEPVTLPASRYISYEDQVRFPMLNMAYPTPALHTREDAALDVLAQVLSGTKGSPIYKAFIESKKAVSASAFQYSRELAGQFQFVIRANPGTPLADMEKLLKETLSEWEKKGVTDDDLAKYKAYYQSSLYGQISTVQGKGSRLASYFTLDGKANYLPEETALYLGLTKEDVMKAYRRFIKDKPAVVLSCLPKGKGELRAAEDTWKMYERTIETESAEYKGLSYSEPKDNFNRSQMPAAQSASPVAVPDFYKANIDAIPLIGVTEKEIPTVNILLSFKAGHRFEPAAKSGLAQLTAAMLGQSTKRTSAEEMENRLDRLGSSMSIYAGDEDFNVSVQCLKKNVTATMKIVEEALFEPKFDTTEFALEKKQQLDQINQQLTNASALADLAYRKLLYGDDHVMGWSAGGSQETVSKLTVPEAREYYQKNLLKNNLTISVSGDITKDQVISELAFLARLPAGTAPVAAENPENKVEKTRIYFLDKKGAAQSEIRVGYLALPYDPFGDYYKANIMNFSFAGAFNSRVNYLLREIKGWTYGTRGGFSGSRFRGPYTISGGFKANATDSTLIEMFSELRKYAKEGITPGELSFTRNAMQQSDALRYESPQQKLFFIKRLLEYDLPKDYVARQTAILNSITPEEVSKLAFKMLPHDKMIVVVVADRESTLDKLRKLEFEVVEIDLEGKPLK
jgi:zinc protease